LTDWDIVWTILCALTITPLTDEMHLFIDENRSVGLLAIWKKARSCFDEILTFHSRLANPFRVACHRTRGHDSISGLRLQPTQGLRELPH
jgi:hypothetical protein